MTDRIDAFDPFEPLTADEAGPDTSGPEGSEQPSSSGGSPSSGAPSGSGGPSSSGRRWSLPASGPARPTPRSSFPSVGRTSAGTETPVLHTDTDTATLREIALPELRSAMARLGERGHEIVLDDCLDEEVPALAVRFRPDRGPLTALTSTGDQPARFELRLGFERDADGTLSGDAPDGTRDCVHVIALEASARLEGTSSVLGRTELRALTPEWVAHRFVEFVAHALERC